MKLAVSKRTQTRGSSIPNQNTKEHSNVLEAESRAIGPSDGDNHLGDSFNCDDDMEVDCDDSIAGADNNNFHGSPDEIGNTNSNDKSFGDVPSSGNKRVGDSIHQVKVEEISFDIIMDNNVTFMTADKKLTRVRQP